MESEKKGKGERISEGVEGRGKVSFIGSGGQKPLTILQLCLRLTFDFFMCYSENSFVLVRP